MRLWDSWRDFLAQQCSATGNRHNPVKGASTERRSPCKPAERQGWDSEEWPRKGAALPVWKSLSFPHSVCRQAETTLRKPRHHCTWFSTSLAPVPKWRWEKEVVGGQRNMKPHCGWSLLLIRAPPKRNEGCAHDRTAVLRCETWGEPRDSPWAKTTWDGLCERKRTPL